MLVGGKILVSRHKRDNHNFIEYMSALMWYLVLAEVNLVLSNTKHTAILCMDDLMGQLKPWTGVYL